MTSTFFNRCRLFQFTMPVLIGGVGLTIGFYNIGETLIGLLIALSSLSSLGAVHWLFSMHMKVDTKGIQLRLRKWRVTYTWNQVTAIVVDPSGLYLCLAHRPQAPIPVPSDMTNFTKLSSYIQHMCEVHSIPFTEEV